MNILIVSKCPTHPTTAGNRRFIYEQVELFKRMGHNVHFLFIKEEALSSARKGNEDVITPMRQYWGNNFHLYIVGKFQKLWFNLLKRYRNITNKGYIKCDDTYPHGLHKLINELDDKYHFDACLVNYFYLTKVFKYIHIPQKVLVTHDYFAYKDILVGSKNILNPTTADQEAIAMQRSPYILALNNEEQVYFRKLSPKSTVLNVYSIYSYHEQNVAGNKNLLFLSGPNMYNLNGLKWFMNEIFPSIIKSFPDVRLLIGGSICKELDTYKNNINIELLGFIENQDDFYSKADVVINPTYQGTGLKIKTFESISYGKVTMVHPHSMIGIYQKDKAPIFASEKAEKWVDYLRDIWNHPEKLTAVKGLDKEYLKNMNRYIIEQYKKFLK